MIYPEPIISHEHIYFKDVRKNYKPVMSTLNPLEPGEITTEQCKYHFKIVSSTYNIYMCSTNCAKTLKDILDDPLPAALMSTTGKTLCINSNWCWNHVFASYDNFEKFVLVYKRCITIYDVPTALHALFRIIYDEIIMYVPLYEEDRKKYYDKVVYWFNGNYNALESFIRDISNATMEGMYRYIPSMRPFERVFGVHSDVVVVYRVTDINEYTKYPNNKLPSTLTSMKLRDKHMLAFSMDNKPMSTTVIIVRTFAKRPEAFITSDVACMIDRYDLGMFHKGGEERLTYSVLIKLVYEREISMKKLKREKFNVDDRVKNFSLYDRDILLTIIFMILESSSDSPYHMFKNRVPGNIMYTLNAIYQGKLTEKRTNFLKELDLLPKSFSNYFIAENAVWPLLKDLKSDTAVTKLLMDSIINYK